MTKTKHFNRFLWIRPATRKRELGGADSFCLPPMASSAGRIARAFCREGLGRSREPGDCSHSTKGGAFSASKPTLQQVIVFEVIYYNL